MAEDLSFMNWGFAPSNVEEYILESAFSEYADIQLNPIKRGSLEEMLKLFKSALLGNTNYWDDSVGRYGEEEITLKATTAWNKIMAFLNRPVEDIERDITQDGLGWQGISNFDGYEWDLYCGFRGVYGRNQISVSMFNTDDETVGATWRITKI